MPLSDIAASMEGVRSMLVEFAFPAIFAGVGTVVSMGSVPSPRPSLPPGGRALPTPTVMPLSDIAASVEGVRSMLVEFAFPAIFAGVGTVVSMGCVPSP